jgi:hypothetical protein
LNPLYHVVGVTGSGKTTLAMKHAINHPTTNFFIGCHPSKQLERRPLDFMICSMPPSAANNVAPADTIFEVSHAIKRTAHARYRHLPSRMAWVYKLIRAGIRVSVPPASCVRSTTS